MAYADLEKQKANKRQYYQNHRDLILKRAREWNVAHPEKVKATKERYYLKHEKN